MELLRGQVRSGCGLANTEVKMDLDTDPTHLHKTNSKWITDLNVKWETMKLLEANTAENLDDLGFGNGF